MNTEGIEELFTVIKLITNETLLCVYVDDVDDSVVIENPVKVEIVRIFTGEEFHNSLSTQIYCPFTESRVFMFKNKDIVHINQMDKTMIQSYLTIVDANASATVESDNKNTTKFFVDGDTTLH